MIPRLLVITPPEGAVTTTVVEVAADLGISIALLLRDPDGDALCMFKRTARMAPVLELARAMDVAVLASCSAGEVASLAPVAQDAGLCGLHLRGDPSEVELLRARSAWPEAIVGASVHGEPRDVSADYVVLAPIFAPGTPSAFPKRAVGLEAVTTWCERHPQVFALGGVTPQNAGACAAAGAYGVAGISTFLGSADTLTDTLRTLAGALTSATDVPPRPRG